MDPKQIYLENLVVSYFNMREDTSIRPVQGGRYKLKLASQVARTDFGRGKEEISLIFDSEEAYNFNDVELITVNHPLLDIIRNDLERREDQDSRICEAYTPLQVVNPQGEIQIPFLQIRNLKAHTLNYSICFNPYYVFTFRITYEMDGGSDNIVKIIMNGLSGNEAPSMFSKIDLSLMISGSPQGAITENEVPFSTIRETSRKIILQRIIEDMGSIGHQHSEQYEQESRRINDFYGNEINKAIAERLSTTEISELEAARDRQLTEWKTKYEFRVKVRPLSILKYWLPIEYYQLTLPSTRGSFTLNNIIYRTDSDQVSFFECSKCGNRTSVNICTIGHHPVCADSCDVKIRGCKVCHDEFCNKHGGACSCCEEPICTLDSKACSYGKHSREELFCPDCITESFEGENLCKACLDECDVCKRKFPHEYIAQCRIGGERICVNHHLEPDGYQCTECGRYTCSAHGAYTGTHDWTCQDHQSLSSCCGKTFRNSKLSTCCCDANERICRDHAVICRECGQAVCEKHRYQLADHAGSYVCAKCRKECAECGPSLSYLNVDLKVCSQGHPHTVCKRHWHQCAVGGEIVCTRHTYKSVRGEMLCPIHVGYCAQTGSGAGSPIYRIDELATCVICHHSICADHRSRCNICGSIVCTTHISGLNRCSSCGQWSCGTKGCSAQSHTCKYCGMKYCRNCISSKGICRACETLKALKDPLSWINYLRGIYPSIRGDNERILGEILQNPNKLNLWASSNITYSVLVVRYTPNMWEFWKESQQLRIVVNRSNGALITIRREAAAR